MFALAFTALMPYTALGDKICFDMEVGDQDHWSSGDDEVNEETESKVCAWQVGKTPGVCKTGIKKNEDDDTMGCIYFDYSIDYDASFKVWIGGDDAMWVDRIIVYGNGWERSWGDDGFRGWCLSQNRNDHLDWNGIDSQYIQWVSDNQCFKKLELSHDDNGQEVTLGWTTDEPLLCRETYVADCKKSCKSGWKDGGIWSQGCCVSFWDCFGDRKLCEKDYECRRRGESEETGEDLKPLSVSGWDVQETNGHWVQLSPQADHLQTPAPYGDVAGRLSQAELDSNAELVAPATTFPPFVVNDDDETIAVEVSDDDETIAVEVSDLKEIIPGEISEGM